MKKAEDTVSLGEILSILWRGKYIILILAVLVAGGGLFFTKYYFADQSTLQVRFVEVQEAEYAHHHNEYIGDFFVSLYQIDRDITRMLNEDLLGAIIQEVDDLPPDVYVSRSGRTIRISARSKELAQHSQLLSAGLERFAAAVNSYRLKRAEDIIGGIREQINCDREYRLEELAFLEERMAEQGENAPESFAQELTRLNLELMQIDYSLEKIAEFREDLPGILARYDLVYDNKVTIAKPAPIGKSKVIVFTVAGLVSGQFSHSSGLYWRR